MTEKALAKHWWAILLRGIVAVIFAMLAFFWPGLTVGILVIVLGLYLVIDGIFAMTWAIKAIAEHKKWWLFLLEGIVGLLVGLMILFWPGITALVMLYFVAAWAIVSGLFELWAGFSVNWDAAIKSTMVVIGIISVLLGVLLFVYPFGGILAAVWLLGFYALIAGIALIIFSFQVKKHS